MIALVVSVSGEGKAPEQLAFFKRPVRIGRSQLNEIAPPSRVVSTTTRWSSSTIARRATWTSGR